MEKPVLVSGIQPTGPLHIGNYLGALKNFVDLQDSGKYRCYFFIADYHSLTEGISDLRKKVSDLAASYLAAGLHPENSILFNQSDVSEHTELAWILSTVTPFGELTRMTQFKDKSREQPDNINAGLFLYPTLMAADVLLYNTRFVPVGNDQDQHLELTRTLARRFNKKYGEIFIEPKPRHTKTPRIMSLADPNKKMSKSNPKGCLFIDDSPETIREKIKSAVTDSGSEIISRKDKPAISNLLLIYSSLSNKPVSALENEFKNDDYAKFKSALAEIIINHFKTFQETKKKLVKKPEKLEEIFLAGSKSAQKVASQKIKTVKDLIYSR